MNAGPVTTTVTQRVIPGHEAAYEQFLEGIIGAASQSPGYLGTDVFRPDGDGGEYRVIYRFERSEELRRWLDSSERADWLRQAEPHVDGPMQTEFLTGLEGWFTLPGRPTAPAPPPYKMALVTWATIFPLISLVVIVLGPAMRPVPLVPRLAITTAVTVPLMTWVVMPRVTGLLSRWLFGS